MGVSVHFHTRSGQLERRGWCCVDLRREFALGCDPVIWDEVVVPCVVDLVEIVVLRQRERDPRQCLHDPGRDQGLELLVRYALPGVHLGGRARELGGGHMAMVKG